MKIDLMKILKFYNIYSRHNSLRKELKVKTPLNAIEKWYKLKPEIFKLTPIEFKNRILIFNQILINFHQLRYET